MPIIYTEHIIKLDTIYGQCHPIKGIVSQKLIITSGKQSCTSRGLYGKSLPVCIKIYRKFILKQMQYRFVVDFGTLMFACRCVPLGGCEDTADGVAANCVRSDRLRFIQFTWPNYGGRQILFFPSSLFSLRERDNCGSIQELWSRLVL